MSSARLRLRPRWPVCLCYAALLLLCWTAAAAAIDRYEIQIYSGETAPLHHLTLELHSNSVVTAHGALAKEQLRPDEFHETFEVTYGLTPHLELGQYFATAQFLTGQYQYAGSRTKVHFGLGDPQTWPLAFGGNIEVAYMRRKAEENPLTLEVRPIVEARLGHWWMVADFAFEQPFSGPGTHAGVTFAPSGLLSYELLPWLTPALEYYGDLGPLRHLPGVQQQQHFLVPPLNLHLLPQLEVNVGVGFGVTRASQGMFLKSILGWTFSSSVPERDRARNVKARAWASRSAGSYQCISLFVNDIEHIGACHAVGGYMWTLYRSVSCFQRFT